jgi:predicted ester cyclase
MTREDARTFFSRRQEAFRRADAVALASDHAENGMVTSPMFATLQGRAAIQESYDSLFRMFSDWDFKNEEPLIDGNRVALPFSSRATHVGDFMGLPGTKRRFEITGVLLFEMNGATIVSERRLYDFTGLLIQTGVLRGKPCS